MAGLGILCLAQAPSIPAMNAFLGGPALGGWLQDLSRVVPGGDAAEGLLQCREVAGRPGWREVGGACLE